MATMLEMVLGRGRPKRGGADAGHDIEKAADGQAEDEKDEGLDQATDELFDAIQNDDKEAFKAALRSFIELC